MAHEIAKLILEHSHTSIARKEAIERALYLGMSLQEIEEYLDWLDHLISGSQEQPDLESG